MCSTGSIGTCRAVWVPREDLAMPHLMHNCGKCILSLYVRLCMCKNAWICYIGVFTSGPRNMSTHDSGNAQVCPGLQAPMTGSITLQMKTCPCIMSFVLSVVICLSYSKLMINLVTLVCFENFNYKPLQMVWVVAYNLLLHTLIKMISYLLFSRMQVNSSWCQLYGLDNGKIYWGSIHVSLLHM